MRSHYCADLDEKDIGREVKLCGWCNTYRDHGGIVFIDLRDRSGLVQLVFDPTDFEQSHKIDSEVRDEYVLIAKGKVRKSGEVLENPKLKSGKLEDLVIELSIAYIILYTSCAVGV